MSSVLLSISDLRKIPLAFVFLFSKLEQKTCAPLALFLYFFFYSFLNA